MRGGKQDVKAL